MSDQRLTPDEARRLARKATEYVMYLRVLLGQAMRAEAEALTVARETERSAK